MAVVMNGTDLYKKAQACLETPDPKNPFLDYEKAFHWFNILLNGAYDTKDDNLSAMYFALGACCLKRDHRISALLYFQKAFELDPEFLEAMNNIAYVYKKNGSDEEAKYYYKRIVEMAEERLAKGVSDEFKKSVTDYYVNYGSMFVARGTPELAMEQFKKGEEYNPDHRMLKYNRALAYLEMGDYARGFPDMDFGDRVDGVVNRNYGKESLPFWDGTPGKKVVVIGEQGIGDEIMYASFLPNLMRDCGVVLDAHPRLTSLFRRTFPEIDVYGSRKESAESWGKRYDFDAKILIGSLARFYCKSDNDFVRDAYLKPDPVLVEKYKAKLESMGEKPKIGISWRGGSHMTEANSRYIPLRKWVEILKLPCDFISLQYDRGIEKNVAEFENEYGVNINHWPAVVDDYDETAALVKNLDLIISVPQSVVHLAGALDTMTLQLTPKKAMWQMGVYGQNMPWYGSVASIWQETNDSWDSVLKTVKEELCALLQITTAS